MISTIPGPAVLDLNTQRDLFSNEGAFPLYQFHKLNDGLKKVFSWAQRSHVPVVSTRLRDLPNPVTQQMRGEAHGPLICNVHTTGYQKVPATTLRRRREMPIDCDTDLPVEGFRQTQEYIFDLPGLNPFECPRLDRLLSETEVGVWLIVGGRAGMGRCIWPVLGLLQRRAKVAMVSDCIGMWDPYEGDMALRQIESKNVEWLTAAQVVEKYL